MKTSHLKILGLIACVTGSLALNATAQAGSLNITASFGRQMVRAYGDQNYSQPAYIEVNAGDLVRFTWQVRDVDNASSYYEIDDGQGYDFCLNPQVPNYGAAWVAQAYNGATQANAGQCMRGHSYNVHYTGTDRFTGQPVQADLTLRVR